MQRFQSPYVQAMLEDQERLRRLGVTPEQEELARQIGPYSSDANVAAANRDLSGLEGRVSRQRAMANELMGTQMPTGRRVGPSQIYVENPYEQAAAGIKRLVGAYQNKKINEGPQAELDTARKEKGLAQARIAANERERERRDAMRLADLDERGIRIKERGADQGDKQLTLDERGADRDDKRLTLETEEAARLADLGARGMLVKERGADRDDKRLAFEMQPKPIEYEPKTLNQPDGTPGTYWLGTDRSIWTGSPEGGGRQLPAEEANALFSLNRQLQSESIESMTPGSKEGERLILQEEEFLNAQTRLEETMPMMGQVLMGEGIEKYAGPINVRRELAVRLGIDPTGDAFDARATDQRLAVARVAPLAAYSEIFRPFSNAEVELSMDTLPTLDDRPEAIVAYFAGPGRLALKEQYNKGLANTRDNPEARAQLEELGKQAFAQYDRQIADAAAKYEFTAQQAREYGIDEDEYIAALKRRLGR